MRTALDRAGLRAGDLGFLEAHGTGTPLGDPIELDAFREALAAEPDGMPGQAAGPQGRLWVGSAKSNIGHLEGASGLAGLIKAVQVLRHQVIPANANFTGLNPHIDLDGTPLAIADRSLAWPRVPGAAPRRAAVSAFGFGGSNAHAVLEEAPQFDAAPAGSAAMLAVPLSAAAPGALGRLAADLADLVEDGTVDLRQTAWTLQSGRRALAHRMLITASGRAELAAAARAFAAGREHPCIATADRAAALDRLARTADRDLAREWLSGHSVSWAELWTDGEPPRRIPLVPYPFQGEPFWLPAGRRPAQAPGTVVLPADHPLARHQVGGRTIAPRSADARRHGGGRPHGPARRAVPASGALRPRTAAGPAERGHRRRDDDHRHPPGPRLRPRRRSARPSRRRS
ncbi:hypothetical protein GCM10020000_75500 [Streptomyces olivoverticillatus]